MTRLLTVRCPSAPWENDTLPADSAWDVCYDLSVEFGYACILDGEQIIGEYQNGIDWDQIHKGGHPAP